MKHSVVIGGAGFVGSWVVDEILKDSDVNVTIVDNLISSEQSNISNDSRVKFFNGSASNIDVLKSIPGKIDYVYQLACFHGNQNSIARPLDDFENGLKTTLVTLEWIKQNHPNARVIYAGAGCAVAEKTWDTPVPTLEKNTTSLLHDSPYSISKITGEMYCSYYALQHSIDVIRVRFQNVYGPREILGAGDWRGTDSTIWRNVVPTFIYRTLKNQKIDVNPSASRDFIYVEDLVFGISLAKEKGQSGSVYNLGSGSEVMISELAEKIMKETSSQSKYEVNYFRSWDRSGRRVANIEKTQNEIGFMAHTSIDEGISKTVDWFKSNLDLIEKCVNKNAFNT
jgi:nucleoside-diphosphate-sugar epimerase